MLLSFLPLSYIVAPNREIANKNLLIISSAMSSSKIINNDSEDINMGPHRERYNKSSINSSRESSTDSKSSDNEYAYRMKIQSSNPNWANQADAEIFHIPLSSQARKESNNQVQVNLNFDGPTIYVDLTNALCPSQDVNRLFLPALSYEELQLANNNL